MRPIPENVNQLGKYRIGHLRVTLKNTECNNNNNNRWTAEENMKYKVQKGVSVDSDHLLPAYNKESLQ